MTLLRLALLIALGVLLSGCATPRYQAFYSYQPPTDSNGLNCLKSCAQTQALCLDDCGKHYAACVLAIEPEVQVRHREALARYDSELKQYQSDLARYHLSLSIGWGYSAGRYGIGHYDPGWPYPGLYPYYIPPRPPQAPSYAGELKKLSAEKCARDCGCQPNYDACFLGCGGHMTPEQRCIANCPAQK